MPNKRYHYLLCSKCWKYIPLYHPKVNQFNSDHRSCHRKFPALLYSVDVPKDYEAFVDSSPVEELVFSQRPARLKSKR